MIPIYVAPVVKMCLHTEKVGCTSWIKHKQASQREKGQRCYTLQISKALRNDFERECERPYLMFGRNPPYIILKECTFVRSMSNAFRQRCPASWWKRTAQLWKISTFVSTCGRSWAEQTHAQLTRAKQGASATNAQP